MNHVRGVSILGLCGLTLTLASGCYAQEPTTRGPKGLAAPEAHPVTAKLIAEHSSIQAGLQTRVGILFDIERGWHIYAQDPGDAGLPTKIVWEIPPVVSLGPLHWPKPQEFVDPGEIRTFGYTGTVVIYRTALLRLGLLLDRSYADGLPFRATVKWLACKNICIPGSANLELMIPFSPQPPTLSPDAKWFR